jgi:hypothetical protein
VDAERSAPTAGATRPLNFPALQRLTCPGASLRLRDIPPHPALQTVRVPESAIDPDDWRHFATVAARDFPSLASVIGRDVDYEIRPF